MTFGIDNTSSSMGINKQSFSSISERYKNYNASDNNSGRVLADGIQVLYMYLTLIGNRAKTEFSKLEAKATVSRDSQEQANVVDTSIAECNKQKDPNNAKAKLPDSIIEFMNAIKLKVNDLPIDEYLKKICNWRQ